VFRVVYIDSDKAEALEPLGSKRKFWFTGPDGRRMLFKAEDRGTGEDWAERIACELCGLLGLPHVYYDLATESEGERPGVVCENCAPSPTSLVLGNQLLLKHDPEYPALKSKYKVRQHTIEAVAEVMTSLRPPPPPWAKGRPGEITSAMDVFIGYVMLDAWIANQDRHHENWGALRIADVEHLAPTFDHGASMARNLTDEERKDRLTTRDRGRAVGSFVRRATSAFYAGPKEGKPMTTVQAWASFSHFSPGASTIWLQQLRRIGEDRVQGLLEEVPPNRLSKIGRDFTLRLLVENRLRLLNGEEA
jgi:hypothetical protein